MNKVDMSLDDIIKLNKKSKKQSAGGRKKNQTFRPQNKIKQFRGRPLAGNQQTKQGGQRKLNPNRRANNTIQGNSPLNRNIKKQIFQAKNNFNNNRGQQQQRNNVKRKQQIANRVRQKARQIANKQNIVQAQRQQRQAKFNQSRKLPQLHTQSNLNQIKLKRTVGLMRSDQILHMQQQQARLQNTQMKLQKFKLQRTRQQQQQQQQQNQQRQNIQKKRRWGRTSKTDPGAIMTISVANDKTNNDVQVILGKGQRETRESNLQQEIREMQEAAHRKNNNSVEVVMGSPRKRRPRINRNRIQKEIRQIQQAAQQNKDKSVQVVVPNQLKKPRIRRNRQNKNNNMNNQITQVQTSQKQQQHSLAEQIKLMQPTVSQKYTFNRVDFGKAQTGMSMTDRFAAPSTSNNTPDKQSAAGRVILF